jgi:glycosyltransferase involved in cell wall biosynthesis
VNVAIVSDAWRPQTNGVVTTLQRTAACLEALGHRVRVLGPDAFRSFACPTYPEIRLSLLPGRGIDAFLEEVAPDTVHVATEGPLGLSARRRLLRRGWRFTTSYHTQFPQYLRARLPLPIGWSYRALRWFHSAAARVMVNTQHVRDELAARGFENLVHWTRGVDTTLFRPREESVLDLPRPVFIYVGRVAVEKNVEAFLSLDLPGTKLVVGGGPALEEMRRRYPQAVFTGYRYDEELAATVAAADVFVFPSLTDTFGLVMLEAMACGVPVAAFPVTGPLDVVEPGVTGILDPDLRKAALAALELDPAACVRQAARFTWEEATRQFEGHLVPARG